MNWSMTAIWTIVMVLMALIEAATPQLVTIWFALGALIALLASVLHAPFWLQMLLFVVVSVAALICTRPLAKKYLKPLKTPTNADRVIGKTGVVQDAIDNAKAVGTVKVDGSLWSARSVTDEQIAAGTNVTVLRIEGVKLIVQKTN